MSATQAAGKFNDEIVPMTAVMGVVDEVTGIFVRNEVTIATGEGIRLDMILKKELKIRAAGRRDFRWQCEPVLRWASVAILMSDKVAESKGLQLLGIFSGIAVTGCERDEMGIGLVFAIPKLLKKIGLRMDDIDLRELNDAFIVQVIYCADRLGIPLERLNVNAGATTAGRPYGVSGARLTGRALIEGQRCGTKYVVATMYIGGGQRAAELFEAY